MTRRPIQPTIRTGREEPEADEELREALSRWASGVTVVTVRADARVHGLTASAFSAVSLEPPLVLVCVSEQAPLMSHLRDAGAFTINLLAADQKRAASVFADRMPVGGPSLPAEGDPVLPGALAALACSLRATHPGGDHRICVGGVERVHIGPDAPPLLYHDREYRELG